MSFFDKLKSGLKKTKDNMVGKIDDVIKKFIKIDEELFEELLEILIISDIGYETAEYIIEEIKDKVKTKRVTDPLEIRKMLKEEINQILQSSSDKELKCIKHPSDDLDIIIVVGINGTGKTTSIGKMASKLNDLGKKVIIAAGDTFRAAAIEQLEVWANRAQADFIKHFSGADPSAVMFDAINAAYKRGKNVLICDTAGRLHTKKNLMEELKKIDRIIQREAMNAQIEKLIVIDATSGNNALVQAKAFHEAIGLDGIILTKLDGTAKGGIIINICRQLQIPVKYIGVGEKIDDLRLFNSEEFVDALFEEVPR
ncbi:MAG: signal recognition particle-docking protein FtsY [Clostridia bacterium]|nr:signal recognition particle-docking protein FtsY [Clostridia bacterium]